MANLKQIEAHLKKKKLNYKIVDLGGEVYTVEGVTQTGVDGDEIVKTLVIQANIGFVALAVRGKDRVDFKKVRRLFGNKSELATPEEVKKIIGVPVGAVCPILIEVPLYFDRKVMALKHINMGSGDLKKGLEMELFDLLSACGKYDVEDLT
jgi:prolyl-tRNA editing enzyme YbaK/EbsC (Cys-tRNA(Pro) deacylase)